MGAGEVPPMALSPQDQAFAAFALQVRRTVGGCALLMTSEPRRARLLTETVIARRHPARGTPTQLLVTALSELVRPRPGLFRPPWARGAGLELVDSAARGLGTSLLAELQRLSPEQRASLVLGQHAGLSAAVV